jgi:hypothetical protein
MIKKIKPYLIFEDSDDFYLLQIIQRRKENPSMGKNSRIINSYFVSSVDYLDTIYPEIVKICDVFNARACIRLNKRSFKRTGLEALKAMADYINEGDFASIKKAYTSAAGKHNSKTNKKWIIDIDEHHPDSWWENIVNILYYIQPVGDKVVTKLPTKNGTHLITKPFNLQEFRLHYPNIEVHKDNPVNLYIPIWKYQ